MKIVRKLLFPFMPIYFFVTWFRNLLYDLEVKKSKSFDFPVICVGNLSVGGTGKTPVIEYLVRLLKSDYKVATLSRGYKRKTIGFKIADANDTSKTIGDEPFQIYHKFKDAVLVAVDTNRRQGIERLIRLEKQPDVILLDDAFQHRRVAAGFNILLTAYNDLYCDDCILPTGNLREPRLGAKRANCIIVTKCPKNMSVSEKEKIIFKLNPQKEQHVFFSHIEYSNSVYSTNNSMPVKELKSFVLVTGIANPKPLLRFLKDEHLTFEHFNFDDHHEFSKKEIQNFEQQELIITTEKDFMRLKTYKSLENKVFYLPIEVSIDNHVKFDTLITEFVKNN